MREIEERMEEAARVSAGFVQELCLQGYKAHRYPLRELPGAGILVWLPELNICEIFIFQKGQRWWWYRVIDRGRIRNRDHLLALSRVSATAMMWTRKHSMRWSDTDLQGRDVRPLSEVQ